MLVWCNIYHKMIQQQADKNELVWFRRLKGRTSCCICGAVVCTCPTSLQTAGWKYSAGTAQCRGEAGKTESCRCTCLIGSLKKTANDPTLNDNQILHCWRSLNSHQPWLIEQGLTCHLTDYWSFWRQCFYRHEDPTNSVKALKEGRCHPLSLTSPCYNNTTCNHI